MRKFLMGMITSLLLLSQAYSAGFNLYEFSANASAMGGAVVARPYDISTIFYNPGGLAFIDGMNFYGGVTLIAPSNKFVGATPMFDDTEHEVVSHVFTPIGIYYANKFGDKLAAGIGITNPYGLALEWEDDFPGNPLSRYVNLVSFYISPVVSYKINDNVSVGGGADIVYSTVDLEQYIKKTEVSNANLGKAELSGDNGFAYGFSFGIMYKAERLGLGFMYRHKVENKYDNGEVDFTLFDRPGNALLESTLVDQKIKTAITFPSNLTFGLYYQVNEKLGLEFDYHWTKWSVFDKLVMDFEDDTLDDEIFEGYNDSYSLRFGANYKFNENLVLLAGYIHDKTPQPVESVSPLLPDNDRNDYSFGARYNKGKINIDLSYMLVDFGKRSTVENGIGKNHYGFNGEYSSIAHLYMISIGYSF